MRKVSVKRASVTAHSEEELQKTLEKLTSAGRIKEVITVIKYDNGRGVNKPLWEAIVEEA